MLQQRISFTVPCTASEVFGFVAREFFANHDLWDPYVREMTQLSAGPMGVGTTGREVRSFLGPRPATFRVSAFEPDQRFAIRNTSGPFHLDRAYTLTPTKDGTQVVFTFVLRPRTLFGQLVGPFIYGRIRSQVEGNTDRLARLLRAGAGRQPADQPLTG